MSDQEELFSIIKPSWLGKITRKEVTEKEIEDAREQIEAEPSYSANGWTPEDLAIYFKERKEAQSDTVLHRKPLKPTRTNGKHNPHRWRQ